MAVPKKRMSNSKTASRRANWDIISAPTIGACSNCGAPSRPHHICAACGFYKGKQITAGKVTEAAPAIDDAALSET